VKALKIIGVVLVGLVLVVRLGLLTARDVPEKARFSLDLNALREAAGPVEACPESARAEQVARDDLPAFGAISGGPYSMMTFGFYSWQLRYADGTSVVLDPVHSRPMHEKNNHGGAYDDAAWGRQEKALAAASVIAVTHEHYDHLGGATESAHFAEIAPRLKLTAAQRQPLRSAGVGRDLSGTGTLESGPEGSLHKVAPCVVAITAAGHTPGSQLFYVRMKGGAELLLIGDVAWSEQNLALPKTRARAVSWMMGEDAEAITHQLRAILDFKKANPAVDVVVAHDVAAMDRRFAAGTVGKGFE
jgi:glyoxylase-like metal-dependent hydrolase (beta-lactamase superfamily II)